MRLKIIYAFFILIAFGIFGCRGRLPKDGVHTALADIVVSSPRDYDCYIKHGGSGVSNNRKVIVSVNVLVFYFDNGSRKLYEIANKTVISNPASTPFPVTVTQMQVPDDGHFYNIEVHMSTDECSECALTYGDPMEPTGLCAAVSYYDPLTQTLSYRGAKARWMAQVNNQSTFNTTLNVGPSDRIMNVPNSCGCIVN